MVDEADSKSVAADPASRFESGEGHLITKSGDILKQIQDEWEAAKAQLANLRVAVEQAERLAQLRLGMTSSDKAREEAYRRLGSAVWGQIKSGRTQLASCQEEQNALSKLEGRMSDQMKELMDILKEGENMIKHIRPPVPPKPKKR